MTEHSSGLVVKEAVLANARPFKWAWNQRVLMGYLNLMIGEEGIGKGNLISWIAASITRGDLDGTLAGPRKVAFIGDEDSWEHIWVPRLHAAGADLTQTMAIEGSAAGGVIDIKKDAEALRELIEDQGIALVYFDQLLDNIGRADSWKDKEVRDAIAPLRRVAQETECALLCSMHPNKRGGSFRDRISGTPAFNALSRSSLLVAAHPNEEGRVVMVRAKGNYTVEPPAFEFIIEGKTLPVDGREIETSYITSIRQTGLNRDTLLDSSGKKPTTVSDLSRAKARLSEMFANGKPRRADEVLEQMEAEGFSERTTQRARAELELKTWKQPEFQGGWLWGWTAEPKIKAKRVVKRRRKDA